MAKTCGVCIHPRRVEIDRALIGGMSYRDAGRRFGLSKSTIARHKNGCIVNLLAKIEEHQELEHGKDLHGRIEDLIGRSLGILGSAEGIGDLRLALGAIREVRSNLELLARVTGELNKAERDRGQVPQFVFPPGSQPIFMIPKPEDRESGGQNLENSIDVAVEAVEEEEGNTT